MKAYSKSASWRRLVALTRGELRLAMRYGILAVYALITVIYILLMVWTNPAARLAAGGVTILSDPAAMGLFFMGAMVMLEKSQRVNSTLAASPVRVGEYIAGKVLALLGVGLVVALVVGAVAGTPLWGVVLCVLLSSPLYTMLAMMLACKSVSLNQFLLLSMPIEVIVFTPALFYWFGGITSPLWLITPGVAGIALLHPNTSLWLYAVLSLLLWNALVAVLCHRVVRAYFDSLGGGKL